MRRVLLSLSVLAGLALPGGWGGPIPEPYIKRPISLDPTAVEVVPQKFKGGERACVIALVLGRQESEIQITVKDAKDKVIGTDQGRRAAVIWYPVRDAEYKIEIRNVSKESVDCYLAVK